MSSRGTRWFARTSALAALLLALALLFPSLQAVAGEFDQADPTSTHAASDKDCDDDDGKNRGQLKKNACESDDDENSDDEDTDDESIGVAAGPPVTDGGGHGRRGDRGRRVDRDRSVLDEAIEKLRAGRRGAGSESADAPGATDEDADGTGSEEDAGDEELAALVESGTIGDVFRKLRGKNEVKEVVEAIIEAVRGEAVIDETKDIENEDDLETEVDKSGKQRKVVRVKSAKADVTVTIPVQALAAGITAVTVTVTPIDDIETLSASVPLPSSSVDISETTQTPIFAAVEIEATDQDGQPITQFEENVTFTLRIDPAAVDIDSIRVVFFDDRQGVWVQVPSTIDATGLVEWSVDHLTLFALLRLTRITHTLLPGLNPITFTGALGTTPGAIADLIGAPLQNLLRFDETTQTFFGFVPNAPATVNTLNALAPRDALFLRVAEGETVQYSDTDIVPNDSGERRIVLTSGLNAIGFTGSDATSVGELLAALGDGLISASQFDPTTQSWRTFVPSAPALANTLTTIDRLDVLFVRYSGPAIELVLPEVAAP